MNIRDILSKVDHTMLAPTTTREDIRRLCDEGMTYGTASVCIPACHVRYAKDYVGEKLPICTVIGFPTGYSTTAVKCAETAEAVANGADEIDMVIRVDWALEQQYNKLLEEIREIKSACDGKLLKVIIECCLLNEAQKIAMCEVVSASGAEFIKTSTGFSVGGATREDVALMKAHVAPHVQVKAAGGIATLQDAEDFLALGAARLGTSRIVKIVKEQHLL